MERAVRKIIGAKKSHSEWHTHPFLGAYAELNLDFDYKGYLLREWSLIESLSKGAKKRFLVKGERDDLARLVLNECNKP